jgi:hypothetical protein
MDLIRIVMLAFLVLESTNVITLYFAPGSRYANGVGIFNAWEKSQQDPEVHDLVRYLVYWVAGTKLIFILLLGVIIVLADPQTLLWAAAAMAVAIASFFWRLFPLIRRMDRAGQITPRNYSILLGWMIFAMILVFAMATALSLAAG